MATQTGNRILVERRIDAEGRPLGKGGQRAARTVTVNLAESPLGWLMRRGLVSDRQFDAGERLRADYEMAQLGARVTMRWDAPPQGRTARGPSEALDPSTAQIAAKRRFSGAIEAAGPGLNDILWRVVCAGEGLSDAERTLGWPVRAGKLVLGLALDRVADFYGIR
jgi:hypothetical protein